MVCLGCFSNLFTFSFVVVLLALVLSFILLKHFLSSKREKLHFLTEDGQKCDPTLLHVAFFHPYCNAGGGGERVLWCAIRALLKEYPNKLKIIVFTGDVDATARDILKKAQNTFNVKLLQKDVQFVYLSKRSWVMAEKYPHFTMLGQSLGSIILGMEAAFKYPCDVVIDSMGYAFTYPIFKYLVGARVGAYVHYPTISTDMLKRVRARVKVHNNNQMVVNNPFLTSVKLFYYVIFAWMYSWVGQRADIVMVNSTWTEKHIASLWSIPWRIHRVYPPCDVDDLKRIEQLGNDKNQIVILSVGQFRPEKDHPLQLQAMYELRSLLVNDEALWNRLRLVIVGSCRNDEDMERMRNMQDLSKHLSLENHVEFKVNITYQELVQCYQMAKIGLHTMWNEHFGISVVELMAAGLIMVANKSGGPMMDIVETAHGSQTGYLAVDAIDYAESIARILYNTKETNEMIRHAARASVDRFSEQEFEDKFLHVTGPLIMPQMSNAEE